MSDVDFQRVKAACALVEGTRKGTGYLIHERFVATAFHVTAGDTRVRVTFGDGGVGVGARVCDDGNQESDCVLLELDGPVEGIRPLTLATALSARTTWTGYGFPALTKGNGMPIDGAVLDPEGRDDKGHPALILRSDAAAAGTASPLSGFSGGPVMVDGAVVGQLRKVVGDPDDQRRPAYGTVYASPVARVAEMLARHAPLPPSKDIRPPVAADPPKAEVVEGGYHVFVSYRSSDERFAKAIVERLEGAGLRVFFAAAELEPGDPLTKSLSAALDQSRAAVVLVSKAWLASPWCQAELDALAHRSITDAKFRLVPVRLDDSAFPALIDRLIAVDFSGMPLPAGPALDRLAYALAGKDSPAAQSATAKVDAAMNGVVSGYIVRIDAATVWYQVVDLAKTWLELGFKDTGPQLAAARMLIGMNRPDKALAVLATAGDGILARRLRAFAHALDASSFDDALTELELLWDEAPTDGEIGGLLAGRYKKKWANGIEPAYLPRARDTYCRAFEVSRDPYPGINAATLTLLAGDSAAAAVIADDVRKILEPKEPKSHWDFATMGEVYLIGRKLERSREWYEKACAAAAPLHRDRAAMRRQARLLLSHVGHDAREFDDVFAIPKVVAFSGHRIDEKDQPPRFPQAKVGAVREAIQTKLGGLGNVHGIASAAAGSDILFLEELIARGGTATVVLPFAEAAFLTVSTGGWQTRWQKIKASKRVDVTVLEDEVPPTPDARDAAFESGNQRVRDLAVDYAKGLDERVIPMVVWDGQEGARGGTGSAVALWLDDGYGKDLIHIDIRVLS